jgi:hypothetical protein
MKINFFEQGCSSVTIEARFGVIDPIPAELSFDHETRWLATIENPNRYDVTFVAIDNCFGLKDNHGNEISLCDGLMKYLENVDFIELKDKDKRWFEAGVSQILSTARIFVNYHDQKQFRRIRAFVSNRNIQIDISASSAKQILWNELGIPVFPKSTIEIKP